MWLQEHKEQKQQVLLRVFGDLLMRVCEQTQQYNAQCGQTLGLKSGQNYFPQPLSPEKNQDVYLHLCAHYNPKYIRYNKNIINNMKLLMHATN